MTAQITLFQFESKKVRAYSDDAGNPWFVASDVTGCLGYSNSRDAISKHVDDDDRNTVAIRDGKPGNPNQTIINESGLYALIFGSDKPEAKRFKKWVTAEVLPAIRKHGHYTDSNNSLPGLLNTTIGTDGFHVLGALVSGKVKKLRGSQRRAMAGEIWAQVRKAFGVSRGEDIPVEKMDAARNFIAAYAVEGQWISGNAPASSFRQEFAKNAHDAFPPDVQAAIEAHTWHLTEQAYLRIAKYVDGSVRLCAGHGQEVSRDAAMQRIKQITLQDALTLSADEMVMVLGMADHIAGCARNYADAVRNGLQALLERGMVIGPMIKPA